MLDKRQTEIIIPKLKKAGLMDEELKFGCIFYIEDKTIEDNEIIYKKIGNGISLYPDKNLYFGGYDPDVVREGNYVVIGQYHIGSILQWSRTIPCLIRDSLGSDLSVTRLEDKIVTIYLDLSKHPMEWTESQNKELAEFMLLVDNNKDGGI